MYFVAKPIVTNGLVLNVDPANTLSYTSGSTSTSDIVGNNVLTNVSIGYNRANGGYFNYTGGYSYASGSSNLNLQSVNISGSNFTIECWLYPYSVSGYLYIASNYNFGGSASSNEKGWYFRLALGQAQFNITTGSQNQNITSTNTLQLNTWNHIVVTGTTGMTSLYENGLFVTSSVVSLFENQNSGRSFALGAIISTDGTSIDGTSNIRMGNFKFYKGKSLSATEIQQNFNALKGRYGL